MLEWNESAYRSFRGVRGGSWNSSASFLAASYPIIHFPAVELAFIGFRVASPVPEPRTSLPAVIALAGLAARRARLERTL